MTEQEKREFRREELEYEDWREGGRRKSRC